MNRAIPFLIAILVSLAGCKNSGTFSSDEINRKIADQCEQLVSKNHIPGLRFSIIFPDGRQENFAAGFSDSKKRTPLNIDHVMFSGSVGKTYAAALIIKQVDAGKINLSDKIIDFFPEKEWMKSIPNIDDITIEMLLKHTSGLPRYAMKPAIWDSLQKNPDKVWSYEDRFRVILDDKPVHFAGEDWSYSDTNYLLLGMLLEKLSGTYYYDLVQTKLLDPNDLTATHAAIRRDLPNLPIGYSRLPEMFRMPEVMVVDGLYAFNPQMEWTGGGIASTTADLARWAKLYFDGGLFSDTLALKMVTPNTHAQILDNGHAYGMGSFIYKTKHGEAYGHTGFVPGFVSIFAWYPEQQIAVALQANCDYAASYMSLVDYLDTLISVLKE